MNETQVASGTVWAVFGHRFAVEGEAGRFLADLGPEGSQGVAISVGDAVTLTGERKPSEIKVRSITLADGTVREIAWPKKPHGKEGYELADPAVALAAVEAEGYAVEGEPRRKRKHFEVVGAKDGNHHELHVELDGTIRKAKPLAA